MSQQLRPTHPLTGKTVKLRCKNTDGSAQELDGQDFEVEDWWINVAGRSWMFCDGNPACLIFAMRSAAAGLPTDNEVIYGKVGAYGHLVHESEIVLLEGETDKP
jgi:hypothetical protein